MVARGSPAFPAAAISDGLSPSQSTSEALASQVDTVDGFQAAPDAWIGEEALQVRDPGQMRIWSFHLLSEVK